MMKLAQNIYSNISAEVQERFQFIERHGNQSAGFPYMKSNLVNTLEDIFLPNDMKLAKNIKF